LPFFTANKRLNQGAGFTVSLVAGTVTVSVDVAIVSVVAGTVVSLLIESVAVVESASVLLLPHEASANPAVSNAVKNTFFMAFVFLLVIM